MRVLVMGGTFDPVHRGHIEVARCAAALLDVQRTVFVVGDGHRHRPPPVLERTARHALVGVAVAHEPSLCGSEVVSARSLTDVVHGLRGGGADVHLVFGADVARRFPHWPEASALGADASLWVVARDGDDAFDLQGVRVLAVPSLSVSSTLVRTVALNDPERVAGLVPANCLDDVVRHYGSSVAPADVALSANLHQCTIAPRVGPHECACLGPAGT